MSRLMQLINLAAAALALALAYPSAPANAITLYFAGGEDTSVSLIGGASVNANAVWYRSAFAREGITVTGTTLDPPTNRVQSPTFSAASTVWVHARVSNNSSGNATTSNAQMVRVLDGGVARILVRGTGTAGQVKVDKRDSSGTITNLVTGTSGLMTGLSTGTIAVDLQVIVGVSGTINLYLDGTLAATFSGDTTTNSNTTLNQVEFSNFSSSNVCAWSEQIVADSDTRSTALWTLSPVAAGNTQSWTPNTVANVNPTAINDANFVTTGSSSSLSEWTTSTSVPAGTWGVVAVVQEARVLRGVTGPQNFEWLVRTIDGSNHVTGSVGPSTSFGNFSNQIWTTNPQTSTSWVTTDIASGFNLGIESLP